MVISLRIVAIARDQGQIAKDTNRCPPNNGYCAPLTIALLLGILNWENTSDSRDIRAAVLSLKIDAIQRNVIHAKQRHQIR
jgi:hypothetical protein